MTCGLFIPNPLNLKAQQDEPCGCRLYARSEQCEIAGGKLFTVALNDLKECM